MASGHAIHPSSAAINSCISISQFLPRQDLKHTFRRHRRFLLPRLSFFFAPPPPSFPPHQSRIPGLPRPSSSSPSPSPPPSPSPLHRQPSSYPKDMSRSISTMGPHTLNQIYEFHDMVIQRLNSIDRPETFHHKSDMFHLLLGRSEECDRWYRGRLENNRKLWWAVSRFEMLWRR